MRLPPTTFDFVCALPLTPLLTIPLPTIPQRHLMHYSPTGIGTIITLRLIGCERLPTL
jgi:hypothetical protein